MPLDPQVRTFLEELALQEQTPLEELSPPQARRQMEAASQLLGEVDRVHAVQDERIPGPSGEVPIRIYRPRAENGSQAAVLYFHGGGWVVGSIDSHDGYCRSLANHSRIPVVSVDYRLAPEAPFPAALEDCYAAAKWLSEQADSLALDRSRLAVAGDSAGGNLAAVVSLGARERGEFALAGQVLIYPITDCDFQTPSYLENSDGCYLTRDAMRWFWKQYLPEGTDRPPAYAAPLRAENLKGLPPALVITAEYDPLRDEGEAYARRLQEAGVPTTLDRYEGMIHGFARRRNTFRQADAALEQVSHWLQEHLCGKGVQANHGQS